MNSEAFTALEGGYYYADTVEQPVDTTEQPKEKVKKQ